MAYITVVAFITLLTLADGLKINFTNCQSPEWTCVNNLPTDLVYTCSPVTSNDIIIHLKDYYTNQITSVTVQNCKDVRVVLDCQSLQHPSQLQRFKIVNCDRVEFTSLLSTSPIQTPADFTIENVREIVSLPTKIFKSPATNAEQKCLGANSLKKIRIVNSQINNINTKAIYNVTGIKSIELENVTIFNLKRQGIEAIMGSDDTLFSIINSNIKVHEYKGLSVKAKTVVIDNNVFGDMIGNAINITTDHLRFSGNTMNVLYPNSMVLKCINIDITDNNINVLKRDALSSVQCTKKRITKKHFNFSRNRIEVVEPYSLTFDYASCKSAGTAITINENKIDCACLNISYLSTVKTELNDLILDTASNNTCISAPCSLPVEVVKLLLENDMCQLNLDQQVVCLLYNDRKSNNNNEVTTDEDVTEPMSTFFVIRQSNSRNGDASAAMTAIDKDDLIRDSHLNMTNRTTIKVYFDSSRDFVETLRSIGSNKKPLGDPKPPSREEYVNSCVGSACRNNAVYNKQKALDFYKFVYGQLRPPKPNDTKKKKT